MDLVVEQDLAEVLMVVEIHLVQDSETAAVVIAEVFATVAETVAAGVETDVQEADETTDAKADAVVDEEHVEVDEETDAVVDAEDATLDVVFDVRDTRMEQGQKEHNWRLEKLVVVHCLADKFESKQKVYL